MSRVSILRYKLFASVVMVLIAAYAGWLYAINNFHTVIPYQVYRSAQPSAADIDQAVDKYGIKSIINLRGRNVGSAWYDTEISESKKLGIKHYDFRMSARAIMSRPKVEQLIALMRKVPKPVLIHCQGGADRSGLASALYVAAIANKGEDDAESQISLEYGHLSIPYLSKAYAMNETWENLEPWLVFFDS